MGRYVTDGFTTPLNSTSELVITARIGEPAAHRRAIGPIAARRLDARIAHVPGDGAFRSIDSLENEADGAFEAIATVGAFCATSDLDRAIRTTRRVLVPGGRLLFLEHVGRPGALGALQRMADPLWSALPNGCHVDHDLPAALRSGGFFVSDLERCTMPSVIPMLRPWVQGVAR